MKLLVTVALLILPAAARAADEPGRDLLEEAKSHYLATRAAITSVEFSYRCTYLAVPPPNAQAPAEADTRLARYARDGERTNHASIMVTANSTGLADEIAFDGRTITERARLDAVIRTTNPERTHVSCPVPEDILNAGIDLAYGFGRRSRMTADRHYDFISATTTKLLDHDCIEVTFAVPSMHAIFVVHHARDLDYWPIRSTLLSDDGKTVLVRREVERFAQVPIADGSPLRYPLVITARSMPGSPRATVEKLEIDDATLKLNRPIPASRFVLTPWQNQSIEDLDTRKSIPAKDPAWKPDASVGFPFDRMIAAAEAAERHSRPTTDESGIVHYPPPPKARPGMIIIWGLVQHRGMFHPARGTMTVAQAVASMGLPPDLPAASAVVLAYAPGQAEPA